MFILILTWIDYIKFTFFGWSSLKILKWGKRNSPCEFLCMGPFCYIVSWVFVQWSNKSFDWHCVGVTSGKSEDDKCTWESLSKTVLLYFIIFPKCSFVLFPFTIGLVKSTFLFRSLVSFPVKLILPWKQLRCVMQVWFTLSMYLLLDFFH